jgi:hypothetical protein
VLMNDSSRVLVYRGKQQRLKYFLINQFTFKKTFMKLQAASKLFLLPIVFLLASCGAIVKSRVTKNDNVPTDFGKDKSTILVIKWRKKYDRKVEAYFKEYYKGDYLLISPKELATTYKDVSKYRYIFNNSVNTITYTSTSTGMTDNIGGSLSFNLTDRVANKYFDIGASNMYWATIVRTYVKKLENTRAKNVGQ